ncbi:MAG TPA: MFS transporter [Planctomycetota bacterium]|nr:MFS transporter [Planctomycetota bacterium]
MNPAPTSSRRPGHAALGLVVLTVFIDMVGFSIIFPLFPALLEHYLALEGQQSAIGRLVSFLADLSGGHFAVVTLFGGLLGSVYSVLQFLFAPIWGSLSDRIGRRPTLLFTLTGTALSYLMWVFAGSFRWLIAARLVGGLMAGNVSTASAVVADTSSPEERAKGMGLLGMGIGLGFVIGPALGGLASLWNPIESFPAAAAYGLNPFSGAAAIALALSSLNAIWAFARLPETLPQGSSAASSEAQTSRRPLNPFRALGRLRFPGLLRTNSAWFLYLLAFSAMEFTLTFLAAERLRYGPGDIALLFVFIGLTIAAVQGGLVRRLAPRYGERRLVIVGLLLHLPAFALLARVSTTPQIYGALFLMATGSALLMPCLSALVSRYTPADRQGLALGTFRSMGALARAGGPLLGGIIWWRLGSAAPYLGGALFMLLPLAIVWGLPAVPATDRE